MTKRLESALRGDVSEFFAPETIHCAIKKGGEPCWLTTRCVHEDVLTQAP